MKDKVFPLILLIILSFSCSNGKKPKYVKKKENVENKSPKVTNADSLSEFDRAKANLKTFEKGKIENTKSMENGILAFICHLLLHLPIFNKMIFFYTLIILEILSSKAFFCLKHLSLSNHSKKKSMINLL